MKFKYFGLIAILGLVLAGCAGAGVGSRVTVPTGTPAAPPATPASGTVTGPTTNTTISGSAEDYLAAADSADAGYAQWKAATTGKIDAQEYIEPDTIYAAVLANFNEAIASIGAKGKTAADITKLTADDNAVIGELGETRLQTASTFGEWRSMLSADGVKAVEASDVVRGDLGLPAV